MTKRKEKIKHGHNFVYPQLKASAINYEFPLGGQIQILDTAKKLGVSITPVREALQRLAAEGLIESKETRGFFGRVLAADIVAAQYEFGLLVLTEALKATSASEIFHLEISAAGLSSLGGSSWNRKAYPDSRAQQLEEVYVQIGKVSGKRLLLEAVKQFVSHTHYIRRISMESEAYADMQMVAVLEIKAFLDGGKIWSAQEVLHEQFEKKLKALPALVKEGIARSYGRAAAKT
ncbi:GntR family transcriptional regulator [Bradyrhizobium uaiense]|uniref:GntR family transcriptional regulator n=1 Tax=Bradyrhizobium uaiense TaxID=2594946 RepID=A0A6P1BPN0_9BRAD|nr:GntR family transcriptional regulator [Bradyrhizobium uaiense]NEU99562.1 GntR family transcriptional regulator [Bradyrhizobium uaiense]